VRPAHDHAALPLPWDYQGPHRRGAGAGPKPSGVELRLHVDHCRRAPSGTRRLCLPASVLGARLAICCA